MNKLQFAGDVELLHSQYSAACVCIPLVPLVSFIPLGLVITVSQVWYHFSYTANNNSSSLSIL